MLVAALLVCGASIAAAMTQPPWRAATEKELAALIPARAPVEKERIETELRTASGVTDGKGRFIAGVVMITAGYSADGRYSHFLIIQAPIRIGEMTLRPGEYVFGYRRADNETLETKFYEAATGKLLGTINARLEPKRGPVRSLLITPPGNSGNGSFLIGRFVFNYSLAE
jgi:hypothetical protein